MKTLNRNILLPIITGAVALATVGVAHAQGERGRVISSTPVVQQIAVPREFCQNVSVRERAHTSGAGAIMGGIAGGAMGNAIGGGSGRAAATALGIFGGAFLGNRIEGRGPDTVRTVQECTTQNTYENQTVAYNVVYEYAGRRYNVEMDHEPGRYVPVSVLPRNAYPSPRPQGQYAPDRGQPDVVYIGRNPRHQNDRDDSDRYERDDNRWDRNWK